MQGTPPAQRMVILPQFTVAKDTTVASRRADRDQQDHGGDAEAVTGPRHQRQRAPPGRGGAKQLRRHLRSGTGAAVCQPDHAAADGRQAAGGHVVDTAFPAGCDGRSLSVLPGAPRQQRAAVQQPALRGAAGHPGHGARTLLLRHTRHRVRLFHRRAFGAWRTSRWLSTSRGTGSACPASRRSTSPPGVRPSCGRSGNSHSTRQTARLGPFREFRPGAQVTEPWGAFPLHPAPNVNLVGAVTGDQDLAPSLVSASRSGDTLSLDISPFSDGIGDTGTRFAAANDPGCKVTGSYEIDQDGKKIASGNAVGTGVSLRRFPHHRDPRARSRRRSGSRSTRPSPARTIHCRQPPAPCGPGGPPTRRVPRCRAAGRAGGSARRRTCGAGTAWQSR